MTDERATPIDPAVDLLQQAPPLAEAIALPARESGFLPWPRWARGRAELSAVHQDGRAGPRLRPGRGRGNARGPASTTSRRRTTTGTARTGPGCSARARP